jgi:hypothetical protein
MVQPEQLCPYVDGATKARSKKSSFFINFSFVSSFNNCSIRRSEIAYNVLGIGEEGAFEKRQLGLCTKAQ